jgi:hypothetical protein
MLVWVISLKMATPYFSCPTHLWNYCHWIGLDVLNTVNGKVFQANSASLHLLITKAVCFVPWPEWFRKVNNMNSFIKSIRREWMLLMISLLSGGITVWYICATVGRIRTIVHISTVRWTHYLKPLKMCFWKIGINFNLHWPSWTLRKFSCYIGW